MPFAFFFISICFPIIWDISKKRIILNLLLFSLSLTRIFPSHLVSLTYPKLQTRFLEKHNMYLNPYISIEILGQNEKWFQSHDNIFRVDIDDKSFTFFPPPVFHSHNRIYFFCVFARYVERSFFSWYIYKMNRNIKK